jgi:hypothetical protein
MPELYVQASAKEGNADGFSLLSSTPTFSLKLILADYLVFGSTEHHECLRVWYAGRSQRFRQ